MASGLSRKEALSLGISEMTLLVMHERHRQVIQNYEAILLELQVNGMMDDKGRQKAISNVNRDINFENSRFYRDY